ncbi:MULTISPECIES: FxSxx-COOH system tetratricopeptide repeat protein [Frankia]|uniref:Uncharacterized protein n=1 Tax=Frankia alni (strain DSM 45986 / CECT 9034 / ACN14a) TaxID=326424 RepID=Q0RFV3_FRAAA|nr:MULTISPECIES: FxSxx-COOH system tetratricopeptide repeat protein [Frankia]CAJ63637.1 conserved hypothetical protein; putative ATP/GTP-binding protein [Frankia alni ACN14a]
MSDSGGPETGQQFLVSYVVDDAEWAEWVAWTLESAGHRALIRAWDAVPGSHPVADLQRTLASGARSVVVLSEAYLASATRGAEWEVGWATDPAGLNRRVLVVRVEDCLPPALLGQIQAVDLFGIDRETARERLLEAVVGGRRKPATEPGFPGGFQLPDASIGTLLPFELPQVWNVPPRLARTIHREEFLDAVRDGLSGAGTAAVCALYGMAGTGKTALAVEYAHRFADDFDVVWWINAGDAAVVAGQVAALGVKLGLSDDAGWSEVAASLNRERRRWLLVLDDVNELDVVDPFRPSGPHGRLLVTSRLVGLDSVGAAVEVGAFSKDEAVRVLVPRVEGIKETEAGWIADLLGYLPLAVEQAASFLVQTGLPPAEYVRLLIERLGSLLDRGRVADRPGVTVANLWRLSVARIQAERLAAVELLSLCAFCAADPIPLDLFTDGAAAALADGPLRRAAKDQLDWAETVGVLVSFSLARRAGSTLTVHRLTAAAVREDMTPADQAAATVGIIRLLAAGLPNASEDPTSWPRWRQLIPHVRAALDGIDDQCDVVTAGLVSRICDVTGRYLNQQGQSEAAVLYLERALALDESRLGPDHRDTAAACNNLGAAYISAKRTTEAIDLYERVVAGLERLPGVDHPDTWLAYNNLAEALRADGRTDEAIALYERIVPRFEAAFGVGDRAGLTARHNLACTYRAAGRLAEATGLLGWTLADAERHLGPNDSLSVLIRGSLADSLVVDNPDQVQPHERTVDEFQELFGPDHPRTLVARHNLVCAYQEAGRTAEARPIAEQLLADRIRLQGTVHPDALVARNNLLLVYTELLGVIDAVDRFEQLAVDSTRRFGPDHLVTLLVRHMHATAYADAEHADDAIVRYKSLYADCERVLGPDDTLTVNVKLIIVSYERRGEVC